jgi:hypothetical protein
MGRPCGARYSADRLGQAQRATHSAAPGVGRQQLDAHRPRERERAGRCVRGSGCAPSGVRSSTTHRLSAWAGGSRQVHGSRRWPSARRVDGGRERAEVFTTTRSPGARKSGRSEKRGVADRHRRGGGDEHAHVVAAQPAPRAARASSWSAARTQRSGTTPASAWSCRHRPASFLRAVAARRQVALDQREQARARRLRAAGGRRCPHPGTPPGASACACRRVDAYTRSAGSSRRESRSAVRGRPSTTRTRPSPRRARRRRRT